MRFSKRIFLAAPAALAIAVGAIAATSANSGGDWSARRVEVAQCGTRLPAKKLTADGLRDKVREAMFWAAGRLYGLRFEQVAGVPVFNAEVTVYRVFMHDGHHVGLWYFDPYARDDRLRGLR